MLTNHPGHVLLHRCTNEKSEIASPSNLKVFVKRNGEAMMDSQGPLLPLHQISGVWEPSVLAGEQIHLT